MTDAQIIAAWNASQSPGEAARRLGMDRLDLLDRALSLKIAGWPVKPLDPIDPELRAKSDAADAAAGHPRGTLPPWRSLRYTTAGRVPRASRSSRDSRPPRASRGVRRSRGCLLNLHEE